MFNKLIFDKALKHLNSFEDTRVAKAIPLFKQVIKGFPCKEAYLNLGNCYKIFRQYDLAWNCYLQAASENIPLSDATFMPEYPLAYNNLGQIAYAKQEDLVAINLYKLALELHPTYFECIFNLSNACLRRICSNKPENAKLAWEYYEYRFKAPGKATIKNNKKDLISWKYEQVDSLVVLTEQGMGDMMMFARYLPLLKKFAKKITVQCDKQLHDLFNEYPVCKHVADTDATHGVSMGTLPMLFPDNIPDGEWLSSRYTKKVADGKLDIGVTWSGNKGHTNDRNRSTVPGWFRKLSKFGELYTLNPTEHGTRGFTALKSSEGWAGDIKNLSNLDLVITVDTSIAHLCGSIGMECWVLMPTGECDFRWGDDSMGTSNIWYPSVKVVRNNGNWEDVFNKVEKMLDEKHTQSLR
jgi:hypothetical protein